AKLAKNSRRRHEIVLSFLMAMGVSEETAATDAEGIEHHVSPETLSVMEDFISKAHR
nr:transcriptional regulator [Planctomycetota bacterium]